MPWKWSSPVARKQTHRRLTKNIIDRDTTGANVEKITLSSLYGMEMPLCEVYFYRMATGVSLETASAKPGRLRVLVADDHPLIRKAVRWTLENHPNFEVVGEASDGAQAVEQVTKLRPDVVVLNVTMPVMDGFEAARYIKTNVPKTTIVILSANADQRFVDEAKKIGIRAFVAKTKTGEALVQAIDAAVKGEDFYVLE